MTDKFNNKYRIESNRAQWIDYSRPDSYFITICIEKRNCILGKIKNDAMGFSEYGKIVAEEIIKMPTYHKRVIIDEWIVMPNHINLLITLGDYDFDNGISLVGDNTV